MKLRKPGVYFGLGREPNCVLLARFPKGIDEATQEKTAKQTMTTDDLIRAQFGPIPPPPRSLTERF